ncbi:NrsF family protein [Lichenifustis flavocetrariae]|uniref:DUF1109 domain-containing protein n=1 Tax=Lichenifustis flavocetrariae TaxID=2949735 RepID=A0AA41YQG2_9HYPH|nr:NrsF family protein [Lichenifustis flavocetrariae]MCW6506651.1 DUF1109 domain-containing protein [Lichenifustis flavocetrariae]
MTAQIDRLIADLGADLRPVRRLSAPILRAAGWLLLVATLAIVLAYFANLPAIAHRLRFVPDMWLAVLGSTLTTVLAAIAAFELSFPDRKPVWALLPLPGLALWVAATGMGCLRAWVIPDTHAADMAEATHCFRFIVLLSIPLSIAMILMIRRACPLRPNLTAATGGLAVAAAAATLLNFFHPYDAGATDMVVHILAIGLVIGANRVLGGRLLTPKTFARRL